MPPILVANADDGGLRAHVNRGIVEAIRRGIVRSVSLMPTGEAFDEAVALLRPIQEIGIGIHLTLVDGRPLLPPGEVSSLVDREGRFPNGAAAFAARYLAGAVRRPELARELEAQIARVRAAGIAPSHLDSHQHLHLLPGLFPLVAELAERHRIPFVRIPSEPLPGPAAWRRPRRAAELVLLGRLARWERPRLSGTVRTADHFRGFWDGGRLDRCRLLALISTLPDGVTELMCHPGFPYDGKERLPWRYEWALELDALTDPEVQARIAASGITLAHFGALSPPG